MKSIIVTKADEGQRVDRFLQKKFCSLPKSLMFKEIRKKNIKVNRKRCEADQRLWENDVIDIYISDDALTEAQKHYDFTKASKELNIVYEDSNILIADKPQGLLCHPDGGEYVNTLISRIKRYLYEKKEWDPNTDSFTPALANRIDRNTGGLVIAAKNALALAAACKGIKNRTIKKYYLAVLDGIPKKSSDTLTGYITKNESKNIVTVSKDQTDKSKTIATKYKILSTYGNVALAEIELITGRTHQIRAHMASIGCPLIGDGKYGNYKGRYRQELYSYKLILNFDSDSVLSYLNGKTIELENTSIQTKFRREAF